MNILYFLEPLLEQQNPAFRVGALKNTILRQANQLMKSGHHVTVLTSNYNYNQCLSLGVNFDKVRVITIDLNTALSYFKNAHESAYVNYKAEDFESVQGYSKFYKDALGDYEPDVIISWESPNNILKAMFPNAASVHMMPGMFSRVPFPELTFVDPCGFFNQSSLKTLKTQIENYKANEEELLLVERIKSTFFDGYLTQYSPFKRQTLDPEGKFRKLVLLPLQVSGYFAFDFHSRHTNQMDLLISVLNKIPSDVGLVVTQYVTQNTSDTPINEKTIEFLRSEYPNLIYQPIFDKLDGVSQYLLPVVDAVVSSSSSIAFQAVFLGLPVYMEGSSHISIVSKRLSQAAFTEQDFEPQINNNVLAFMLTRLMPLTVDYTYNSDWLSNYLAELVASKATVRLSGFDYDKDAVFNFLQNNPINPNVHEYTEQFIRSGKPHVAIKKLSQTGDEAIKSSVAKKEQLFKLIGDPKIEFISFDIFDTLIVRPFAKPVDLFRLLDDKVRNITDGFVNDFHIQRIKAEQNCKKNLRLANDELLANGAKDSELKYEITISEIYNEFANITHIEEASVIAKIEALEFETELKLLYPRRSGIELYRAALNLGKKVVITSDMYLSKSQIEQILSKNQIHGYHKLFLSSDIGLKKHEGHLYSYVLDDLNTTASKIIHIGDNVHGDIKAAKEYGIQTIHTPRTMELFYRNKPARDVFYNNRNKASLSESICVGLAANKIFEDPSCKFYGDTAYHGNIFNLGYFGLGWMFFAYCKWIVETSIEDGITDLYFLARDGDIINKVYDIIAAHYPNAPKSHYLLASRRSARVASIMTKNDLSVIARSAFYSGTIKTYFESKLGINVDVISEGILKKHGFEEQGVKSIITTNDHRENLYNLTMELSSEILRSAKVERNLLKKYFLDSGLYEQNKKVAVVDIGYAGTMQEAMIKMLGRDVGGYYLMTFESALRLKKRKQIVRAFAGDFVNPEHSNHPICNLGLAFEVVFSNTCGSFIKMTTNGDSYAPVFESTEGEEVKKQFIPLMQEGVLCFSKDITSKFQSDIADIYFDNQSCFAMWENTLTKPSGRDAMLFEGVTFDDNFAGAGWRYMVPPRVLAPYSEKLKSQTVWQKGTEVFFRIPAVAKDKGRLKIGSAKTSKLVHTKPRTPGPIASFIFGAIILNEKKLRKFHRNPDAFFADSKNRAFKKFGKLYCKICLPS